MDQQPSQPKNSSLHVIIINTHTHTQLRDKPSYSARFRFSNQNTIRKSGIMQFKQLFTSSSSLLLRSSGRSLSTSARALSSSGSSSQQGQGQQRAGYSFSALAAVGAAMALAVSVQQVSHSDKDTDMAQIERTLSRLEAKLDRGASVSGHMKQGRGVATAHTPQTASGVMRGRGTPIDVVLGAQW